MASYATTCAGTAWAIWTTDCDTSCTNDVWEIWTEGTWTTCNTARTNVVWKGWASTTATNCTYTRAKSVELSAEERAQIAAREAEYRKAEEKRKAEEEAADKRAEELLVSHLDAEQKKEYRRDRTFSLQARDGRRYRVRRAWSGHVERLDAQGRAVERFCIHPREKVPLPDNQLLAKLMLETDPDEFRRVANVTPLAV